MIPHVSINPLKSNVEYTLWVDIGNLTDFLSVLKRTITIYQIIAQILNLLKFVGNLKYDVDVA